jgi:hypothetical protein
VGSATAVIGSVRDVATGPSAALDRRLPGRWLRFASTRWLGGDAASADDLA